MLLMTLYSQMHSDNVTGMLQISNLIMGIVLNCREVVKCLEVLG